MADGKEFDEEKEFDEAFNTVTGEESVLVEEETKSEAVSEQEPDKEEESTESEPGEGAVAAEEDEALDSAQTELTEVEKLQQTVMRQAAAQSALQKKLNETRKVRDVVAPIIDDDGVFTESFKDMQQEFPEADFGRVEDIIKNQQQQIQQLTVSMQNQQIDLQNSQAATHLQQQMDIVKRSRPGVDIAELAQSDEFNQWQKTLTPGEVDHVKSAVNADEINNILNVFISKTGYKNKAVRDAESRQQADDTAKNREVLNKAAQVPEVKPQASPAINVGDQLNESAIFDKVFSDLGVG